MRPQAGALHRLEEPQRPLLASRDRWIRSSGVTTAAVIGGRTRHMLPTCPRCGSWLCASEAPRAPLNGSRLVLHELLTRLSARADLTVLALRRPDQDGPAPTGFELLEIALADPAPARAWALRGAALTLREPVEARRLARAVRARAPAPARRAPVRRRARHARLAGSDRPALGGLPALIAPLDAWHLNVRAEADRAHGAEQVWRRQQERAVRRWEANAYRPFKRVVLVTDEDARGSRGWTRPCTWPRFPMASTPPASLRPRASNAPASSSRARSTPPRTRRPPRGWCGGSCRWCGASCRTRR